MLLNAVSLSLVLLSVIIIILGIVQIHTYPGKIAKARNHPQVEAIEVTSLLGLIIFPFWMFALVWAYSGAVIGALYDRGNAEKETKDSKANGPTKDDSGGEAAAVDPES